MSTFTEQINQENRDLAEIQKVARMTPKKMIRIFCLTDSDLWNYVLFMF